MHLSRKANVVCGIGIAAVIIAGVVVMSSTPRVTPRFHMKLIERPDDSFELVEVKTKHYSDIAYLYEDSFRGRALVAKNEVLIALRLRKSRYYYNGPCDFVCITYRAKNLNSSSGAQPLFRDDKDKEFSAVPWLTRYDPKTKTGVVEVPLPQTPTNFAGWKLELIPLDRSGFNSSTNYAVFSL
jgi:hypothetical protein